MKAEDYLLANIKKCGSIKLHLTNKKDATRRKLSENLLKQNKLRYIKSKTHIVYFYKNK